MPGYDPCRLVPNDPFEDDEEDRDYEEQGLPLEIFQMPYNTEKEKVDRMRAKLSFYNVRTITDLSTVAALRDRKKNHNEAIERYLEAIDEIQPVQTPGVFIGEYRYSTWPFFPGIMTDLDRPHRHAVKAHFVPGTEILEYFVVNTTLHGKPIGKLDSHPLFVHTEDIIFLPQFADKLWGHKQMEIEMILRKLENRELKIESQWV